MNKEYVKLLCASCISRFGDSIDAIAYGWMVYEISGSPALLATLFAVNGIPSFVLNFCVGPVVHHFNKKKLLIISDVGRGIIVSITAILYALNLLEVWHLFALTFLTSTFEVFSNPASSSIVRNILKPEEFESVLGKTKSIKTIFELAGLGCAGFLIATIGIQNVILIDGITFFVCAIIIVFVKHEETVQNSITLKEYTDGLTSGIKHIFSNSKIVFVVFVCAFAGFFLTPVNTLVPAYVKDLIQKDPNFMSLISGSFSVSFIIGGLITAAIVKILNLKQILLFSGISVFLGYCGFCLGINVNNDLILIGTLILSCLLIGAPVSVLSVSFTSEFMRIIDKKHFTTVTSVTNAFSLSAVPLGAALAGAMLVKISIPTVFLLFGGGLLLVSIVQMFIKDKEPVKVAEKVK